MEKGKDQSKEEKYGLYLNIKIYSINKNGIYDHRPNNSHEKETFNIFIPESGFLVKDKDDKIKCYAQQKDMSQDEIILFYIRIRKNKCFLEKEYQNDNWTLNDLFSGKIKLDVNEKNISILDEFVWRVLNIDNPNDDYYLKENDILKFGYIKYFVREIHIENKKKEEDKQKQIFNLITTCSEYKICNEQCEYKCNEKGNEHANCNKEYRLCKCEKYQHIDIMRKWLDNRVIKQDNNKKTVKNYEFRIFHCIERTEKDPDCDGKKCEYCNCKYCNTYYPLYIKIPNQEEIIEFYPIKKPEKSDYLILESFNYLSLNNGTTEKNIHIAELTEEDINIGRVNTNDITNDIIINDDYISREQATIKYNKEEGKLILKNRSKKSGTLILVKDNKIEVKDEKGVRLQINNIFIEAKLMKEKDFLKNTK